MRTDRKAKPIFIESGVGGKVQYMCRICHVYHVPINSVYKCPKCGEQTPVEGILKADDFPIVADLAEPMIGNKRQKKKDMDAADLPVGAYWVKDETDSS